jgi:hypothetical protein
MMIDPIISTRTRSWTLWQTKTTIDQLEAMKHRSL